MESTSFKPIKLDPLLLPTEVIMDDTDLNLLKSIDLECNEVIEDDCLPESLNDYMEKVSYNTGLFKNTIKKAISQDLKNIDPTNRHFELTDCLYIFQYVAELYTKQVRPTFKNIFALFKRNNNVITFSQFQYMMSCLGFEFRKTELGEDILIEDPAQTFKRYFYLKQINNFRSKQAPVYYIDERVFDSTYTFPKIRLFNKDINISSTAPDGYVFFHAVSKQGFLNGLFCSPATKRDFLKWVSHILIPLLPGPSIIVMDNKELHGSPVNTITKYHSKTDMIKYLRQKNIPFNEHLHKAELYELVTKCSTTHASYDVDEILKVHGHHVLRLPPNFEDLSMTHFLWKYLLGPESDMSFDIELSQVKIALLERLSRLPQELWDRFHESLLIYEQSMSTTDAKAYNALELNFKIS